MSDRPPELPAPEPRPLLPGPQAPLLLEAPKSLLARHPRTVIAMALGALVLVMFVFGWFMHHRHAKAAERATREAEDAIPLVVAVQVEPSAALGEMLLPGSLSPIEDAAIYARAEGYVGRRLVDIGDSVRKDQLLAVIESPELDQQFQSSLASIADARAKLDLARLTLKRYEVLLTQDSIARQDVDTQRQATRSAEATLDAAIAERRRLEALRRYEQVRAPFAGVITARNVEQGALISGTGAGLVGSNTMPTATGTTSTAGSSTGALSQGGGSPGSSAGTSAGTGSVEMFHIAQIDRLRVYVNVPQESATLVKPGSPAAVIVQQSSDAVFGAVVRTARALDPSARTLLAEVQIPNVNNALLPGMFAHVRFIDARPNAPLLVSGESLITRADGTSVAVLQPLPEAQRRKLGDSPAARCARTARLQPVALGRDYGTQVEITRGLKAGEFVVLNPGDSVRAGAVLLPQLQAPRKDEQQGSGQTGKDKKGGPGKGGDKKKDKDGGGKTDSAKDDDKAQDTRRRAETTCLEQQASAQAPAASAAAPSASVVSPAAPTDEAPAGIGSPGMTAPTQGQGHKPK